MNTNEIRDYLDRAPKRWAYRDGKMVNFTGARLKWLASMCQGTLHERINRRAGIVQAWLPWKNAVHSAIRRHRRNQLRTKSGYVVSP